MIVAWIDGGEHFLAMRTEEAIASFAALGRRAIGAEGGDGDGHGQVFAEVARCNTAHNTSPEHGATKTHSRVTMIAKLNDKPGFKELATTHSSRPAVVALQKPARPAPHT